MLRNNFTFELFFVVSSFHKHVHYLGSFLCLCLRSCLSPHNTTLCQQMARGRASRARRREVAPAQNRTTEHHIMQDRMVEAIPWFPPQPARRDYPARTFIYRLSSLLRAVAVYIIFALTMSQFSFDIYTKALTFYFILNISVIVYHGLQNGRLITVLCSCMLPMSVAYVYFWNRKYPSPLVVAVIATFVNYWALVRHNFFFETAPTAPGILNQHIIPDRALAITTTSGECTICNSHVNNPQRCVHCDKLVCKTCNIAWTEAAPSKQTWPCCSKQRLVSYMYMEERVVLDALQRTAAELLAMPIDSSAARCPGCGVGIYKDGGCKHMYCTICGLNFCWYCRQSFQGFCRRCYNY